MRNDGVGAILVSISQHCGKIGKLRLRKLKCIVVHIEVSDRVLSEVWCKNESVCGVTSSSDRMTNGQRAGVIRKHMTCRALPKVRCKNESVCGVTSSSARDRMTNICCWTVDGDDGQRLIGESYVIRKHAMRRIDGKRLGTLHMQISTIGLDIDTWPPPIIPIMPPI
jgi:hypothetical protein